MDIKSVEFSRAVYQPGDFPRDQRPQIAFVGRSNVGKSSLINAVLNRKKIARVSQTPGKTQAVQFYLVNERFYLVDLPGYGYAKVPQSMRKSWGALVQGYLETSDALRLFFLLLDVRRIPSGEDLLAHQWASSVNTDERILLTKSDKLSSNGIAKQRLAIAAAMDVDPELLITSSAETKRGIEDVRRAIASHI